MTIDRGSHEISRKVDRLTVCGDAIVTVRGEVLHDVEVLEVGTAKIYATVRGSVVCNTAGRVDVHGTVEGEVSVTAGEVRVIGSVGAVTGPAAASVKICTGALIGGIRQY